PGSRLLARRLAAPLCDPAAINARLEAVAALRDDTALTGRLRQALKSVPDVTRALTRLALHRGGPRDLVAIANAIGAARLLAQRLAVLPYAPAALSAVAAALDAAPEALATELVAAIDDEPPLTARDGGFVRAAYEPELDNERQLASETRAVVAALQARLIAETDVRSLKIRHNGVLGYFVEVPVAHGARLLEPPLRET